METMRRAFFLIWAVFAFSCKSEEERLEGKWKIESYSCAGIDSMALIRKANMDGTLELITESTGDDRFGLFKPPHEILTVLDTMHLYNGNWIYDKPFLQFKFGGLVIGTHNKIYYSSYKDTTNFKNTIPYGLLRGDWLVAREGSRTLKLTKIGRKVIMELKRI